MDKKDNIHFEQNTLGQALKALYVTTGLTGRVLKTEPRLANGARPDALIQLEADDKPYEFVVEIKRVDRFAALGAIKNQLALYEHNGLLVTPYITAETADRCREMNICFIDVAGNAYLRAPGLFVFVKGCPRVEAQTATRAGTATALRVIFALLCKPELLNAPYREIVAVADIALGAIGWIFFDLNERGLITGGTRKTKADRRFLEPKRLFDEWVINYPIKLRPKLNVRRFTAQDPNWWKHTDLVACEAMWGGEVAADKLTGYLKPEKFTIYLNGREKKKNLTRLVVENKLRADHDGNIEILDAFWNFRWEENRQDVVPPILVYADLLATHDPRNFEVARMIYDKTIDNALRQNG